QLLQAERFGHVVVPADGQPADLVLGGVHGGQEDDGHVGAGCADLPADLGTENIGQYHVKDDQIRTEILGRRDRRGTGGGGGGLEPFVSQGGGDEIGEVRFIVHDKNPGHASSLTRQILESS